MNTSSILKNISRNIQLNKAEEDFFISLLRPKNIKRKEFLLTPGQIATHTYYIVEGCMKNYQIDNKGVEHIAYFAVEDFWISDLQSFLTQKPSDAFVEAIEDSQLLQLSKENLEKLFEKVPKFERHFRILYQNAFLGRNERIMEYLLSSAEERFIHFITKFPHLEQRIPQKQIAAYLGITPEHLSVLRSGLARKK